MFEKLYSITPYFFLCGGREGDCVCTCVDTFIVCKYFKIENG